MKGKAIERRRIGKTIILILSFLLTIILTASITLAWFYDSDWASKSVTMGGAVGIELRPKLPVDNSTLPNVAAEAGQLHFVISENTNGKAYPGQGVEVKASVYNNGGRSMTDYFGSRTYNNDLATYDENLHYNDDDIEEAGNKGVGSACYIRAHFAVATNIGKDTGVPEGEDDPDQNMNARVLYDFMHQLIKDQNNTPSSTFKWIYFQNQNAVVNFDNGLYMNGEYLTEAPTGEGATIDAGYFYLCKPSSTDANNAELLQLDVGDEAAFLWNGTFVIPWQLTNISADKYIFVAVTFQAIQTFIPRMTQADAGGSYSIVKNKDNQLAASECTVTRPEVQIVFNTCNFTPINYRIKVGENTAGGDIIIDFSQSAYDKISIPTTTTPPVEDPEEP